MPEYANDLDDNRFDDDRFVRATALDAALRVTDHGDQDVTTAVLARASLFETFIRTGATGPSAWQSMRDQIIREIEHRLDGSEEARPVDKALDSLARWIGTVRP